MKQILKEVSMPWLTWKQKLIVFYFVISMFFLCVGDDTPLWIIGIIVLNFGNAARLVKNLPLPKSECE